MDNKLKDRTLVALTSDVNRTQVQLNSSIDSSKEDRERLDQNQERIDVTIANLTATGEIIEKKLANLTSDFNQTQTQLNSTIGSFKKERERLDQTIENLTLNNDDEYLKLTQELEKLTTTINNNNICIGKSSAWLESGGIYVYVQGVPANMYGIYIQISDMHLYCIFRVEDNRLGSITST